jgi:hypothetical protein
VRCDAEFASKQPSSEGDKTAGEGKGKKEKKNTAAAAAVDSFSASCITSSASFFLHSLRRAIRESMLSFASHFSRSSTLAARCSHFSLVYELWGVLGECWRKYRPSDRRRGEMWLVMKNQQKE